MKKLIFILLLLLPIVGFAQQPWFKYSPMDYAWKNVGFSEGQAVYTSLAFSPLDDNPYVAYMNVSAGLSYVNCMKFNGTAWVYVGQHNISDWEAGWINLAFNLSGQPYLAYEDWLYWTGHATVKKLAGNTWVTVGDSLFSAGECDFTSLAISPASGQPYVAFQDGADSVKVTVMNFDGTNWVYVGKQGFTPYGASYTSLAFCPTDDYLYLAFVDYGNSDYYDNASVMRFYDGVWEYVGNPGFSAGTVCYTSLAFSPSGQPYVAYMDYVYSFKVTVMKFDGTSWVYVGSPGFSDGAAYFESLAFSPSGQLYVAFADTVNSWKATVMTFDGTNWVYVGTKDFSTGMALYTSLAINPSDNQPNVAYEDFAKSQKATVMKYDSVFVGINERQGSRFTLYPNPAKDKCNVQCAKCNIKNIQIFDLTGETVYDADFSSGTDDSVEVSFDLPAGVYFVKITDEKGMSVQKMVVE